MVEATPAVSTKHPVGSTEACVEFTAHVRMLEGAARNIYGLAAKVTRQAERIEDVAAVWTVAGEFCDAILMSIQGLRDAFPDCGTPELYDLVLDFKLACDARRTRALEEIECQKTPTLSGLFPPRK